MNNYVLQNPDYKELYWDSDYGWVDIDNASTFFESDLKNKLCVELSGKGQWVIFNNQKNSNNYDFV